MNAVDRAILTHCREDFRPLRELRGPIPSGTLYRHAGKLVRLGWLRTEHALYRTTEPGLRQLVEGGTARWDQVIDVYPPLALVPTAVHRALVELIWAAVVARQHLSRPDRHPFFVVAGATLHWKTSLGRFVCHALGLDPTDHIVDCGTESGKSLGVRRGGTGTLGFKRELLNAPFLVLDEVHTADPTARGTLGLFLSGRRVIPVENEHLTVQPVALLTLNPRPKVTLEDRTGLTAPQIRRGFVADLDRVPMPDLATTGEGALAAAQARGPLTLGSPGEDCQALHSPIVDLTRALLRPEAHTRVDVEGILTLCAGMTAFLPTPVEAIAQVGYDVGLLAETLGWTRPGWIETVTAFVRDGAARIPHAARSAASAPVAPVPPPTVIASPAGAPPSTVSLQIPARSRPAVPVPNLSLSEALRARLVWFAVETRRPLEEALDDLLDFFLEWQTDDEDTLDRLDTILELARTLTVAEIDAATLHDYLQARAALATHDCSIDDVPNALRLIAWLDRLPGEPWNWDQAEAEVNAFGALLGAGIGAEEVAAFLARHQRLAALGFDADTTEALAAALARTGATGERREAVLEALVNVAHRDVACEELEVEYRALEADIATLETDRTRLRHGRTRLRKQVRTLEQQAAAAHERLAALDGQSATLTRDLEVVRGFRAALLLQSDPAVDAFFADLERLGALRRAGRAPEDRDRAALTWQLSRQIVAFLGQLAQAAAANQGQLVMTRKDSRPAIIRNGVHARGVLDCGTRGNGPAKIRPSCAEDP
jgi:hypothetical protein